MFRLTYPTQHACIVIVIVNSVHSLRKHGFTLIGGHTHASPILKLHLFVSCSFLQLLHPYP